MAAGAKQRFADDRVEITSVIELLDRLRERDARTIRVACTHGLFASDALKRIGEQPDVAEIVCTNTVPIRTPSGCPS